MAGPWFVRSLAGGAGTGADWANAFTTLTAANTASTAGGGETFWIADDHAESTAGAVSLTSKGVAASPNFHYCVDHTVASPGTGDLKTTGAIATSAANAITMTGVAYFYGVKITAGSGASAANLIVTNATGNYLVFEACSLIIGGSGAGNLFMGGTSGGSIVDLINTTVKFAAVGQSILLRICHLKWRNTLSAVDATGSTPTTLFAQSNGINKWLVCMGVDFSLITGTLIAGAGFTDPFMATFIDCKLGVGVVRSTTPPSQVGGRLDFIRCDSGATNYLQARFWYQGTLTQETTIVRTGGASDGTTPLSWKLVSTANAKPVLPFESFPIAIWNDTIGSPVTATVCGIWGGGAVPNNDDIWIEVEYLGSTLTPQASFANNTKANFLAIGTALPSDSSTWGGSTTKFKMAVTFTPQMKGYIYVRVYAAAASQTFYVDPLVVLT